MTHPDSTVAFNADASRTTKIAELEQQLQDLKNRPAVIDETGQPVANEAPEQKPQSKRDQTVTIAGDVFHFRVPTPAALMAFSIGCADRKRGQLVLASLHRVLAFHLDDEDFDHFLARMSDPDDQFGDDEFGKLIEALMDSANNSAEAAAPTNGPQQ